MLMGTSALATEIIVDPKPYLHGPTTCALSPRYLLGHDYESSAEHQVFHSLSRGSLTEQQRGWRAHNTCTPTRWGLGNRRKTTQASNGVFHQVSGYQTSVFYSRKAHPP